MDALEGHRVYVTLEPCAMCGGMLMMSRAAAVFFGQKAHGSGNAIARLQFDSSAYGGYCPYPYSIIAEPAPGALTEELEALPGQDDKGFLFSEEARRTFENADARLRSYRTRHAENEPILLKALSYLERVPAHNVPAPYKVLCPPEADGGGPRRARARKRPGE